jgi:hypothetical protein
VGVHDVDRLVVMTPCVCGCPAALHMNYEDCCINWHTDGCQSFVADCEPDDQKYPTPAPFSNHYPADGRYKTPKNGWPLHD